MRRVPAGGWTELLDSAFALLPDGMRTRVQHVDFLCGVSPHFAGIVDDNTYPAPFEGYAWADVAHVLFADHQVLIPRDRRRATVYLPAQVASLPRRPRTRPRGAIYRADNWEYLGAVKAGDTWLGPGGEQRGRKRGGHTRTVVEMEAEGFARREAAPKLKFVRRNGR